MDRRGSRDWRVNDRLRCRVPNSNIVAAVRRKAVARGAIGSDLAQVRPMAELLRETWVKAGRKIGSTGWETIDAGFGHWVKPQIGTSSDLNAGLAALSG